MKNDIAKEIMRIMRDKQVSRKWEVYEEVAKNKRVSKRDFEKTLNELIEKHWLVSIYGSDTTFAVTQKGMRESKLK